MKKYILLLITLLFTQSIFAKDQCRVEFKKLNICADIQFLKPANRKSDSKFKLIFLDKKLKRVFPAQEVKPLLWMVMKNGHEHGSEEVEIKKVNSYYQVSNVWFLMLGQWMIKIPIYEKGKKVDSASVDLCLLRDSSKNHFGKCKL